MVGAYILANFQKICQRLLSWPDSDVPGAPEGRSVQLTTEKNHVKYGVLAAVFLFSKLNEIFFGYLDPENINLDNENK